MEMGGGGDGGRTVTIQLDRGSSLFDEIHFFSTWFYLS